MSRHRGQAPRGSSFLSGLFAFLMSPWLLILASVVIGAWLAVSDAIINKRPWAQSLPPWIGDWGALITILFTLQPLLGLASQKLTRRQRQSQLRRPLNKAFRTYMEILEELGRVGSENNRWDWEKARDFERKVVQTTQRVLEDSGIKDPRICLYERGATDEESARADGQPFITSLQYVYHYAGVRPSQVLSRPMERDEDQSLTDLFATLDDLKPSTEPDRPEYTTEHHWRSAIRHAVCHGQRQWGVITADSPRKGELGWDCAYILGFAADLIALARLYEERADTQPEAMAERLLQRFRSLGQQSSAIEHPQESQTGRMYLPQEEAR